MAFSSCMCVSGISLKMATGRRHDVGLSREIICSPKSASTILLGQQLGRVEFLKDWTFNGGSRIVIRPRTARSIPNGKRSGVQASCQLVWLYEHVKFVYSPAYQFLVWEIMMSLLCKFAIFIFLPWFTGSQVASTVFTTGTASVLPFYTLMVFAPKAELTKKTMKSSVPYIVLGLLYACLLCLSWTPDTIRLMFASQYLLPELPGIAKLFSTETALASAWIHLMVVDLFAARQVFHDGIENKIETRHSVTLCLLFCPIGILTHVVTKALIQNSRNTEHK